MVLPCPACGCAASSGDALHDVAAALADGDVDRAIERGLLDLSECTGCARACNEAVAAARESRLAALAARERFRARERRLARRIRDREQARASAAGTQATAAQATASTARPAPALPAAAAAALARAKARAAGGNDT